MDVRHIEWATYGETFLLPLPGLLTLVACVLTFTARRSGVFLPLFAVCALIPHTQRIVVFDLDFSMQRIIVIAGLATLVDEDQARSFLGKHRHEAVFILI